MQDTSQRLCRHRRRVAGWSPVREAVRVQAGLGDGSWRRVTGVTGWGPEREAVRGQAGLGDRSWRRVTRVTGWGPVREAVRVQAGLGDGSWRRVAARGQHEEAARPRIWKSGGNRLGSSKLSGSSITGKHRRTQLCTDWDQTAVGVSVQTAMKAGMQQYLGDQEEAITESEEGAAVSKNAKGLIEVSQILKGIDKVNMETIYPFA
eukprot:g45435.t1